MTGGVDGDSWRRLRLPLAVLAPLALLHLWLSTNAGPGGFLSDDSLYLLMAEWFAGSREPVVLQVATYTHLPPLYSLALAAVGAGGDRPLPGHVLNGVLFVLALALTAWLHRRRQPAALAAAVVAVVALAPTSLLHAFTLWSEPLYLVCSLGVLCLLDAPSSTPRRWLLVALLAGLALGTRTAALALLVAVAWSAWRRAAPRPWLLAAIVVLPSLAWSVIGPPRNPPVGYLDLLYGAVLGDGGGLPAVVTDNLHDLWQAWVRSFELLRTPLVEGAATAAALPVLFGWLRRLREGTADAVYVLAYLLMLLPWPTDEDKFVRFLLPLLPLAVGYAADAGLVLARGVAPLGTVAAGVVGATPIALLALVATPSVALVATRLADPPPAALAEFRFSPWWVREPDRAAAIAIVDLRSAAWHAARALRDHVSESDCLYARPAQFHMLHARRPTWLPAAATAENGPGCRYAYASIGAEGVIVLEGIPADSTLVFEADTLLPPRHPVGLLFRLPGEETG